MVDDLYKCGYCSGSGSFQWQRKAPYPEGTHGAMDQEAFAKVRPNIETVNAKCPVCRGGQRVVAPYDLTEGGPRACPECRASGRRTEPALGMPPRCSTCSGTGWVGGVPAGGSGDA